MRLRSARRAVIVYRTRDYDLERWADAVVANGGTVSEAVANIVEKFIAADKASGVWALRDDCWRLWGENAAQALTSLKQRRLATAVNAPTFTANRGYAFDGITQYINTGFIPSTHAVAMTGINLRIGAYTRTNLSANRYAAGADGATNQGLYINPRGSGTAADRLRGKVNCATTSASGSFSDSRGYSALSRNDTTFEPYKNGASAGTLAPLATDNNLPTVALYIGGMNAADVLTLPRATSVGFVDVGASLSAAQELAAYTALQATATAVGAQV